MSSREPKSILKRNNSTKKNRRIWFNSRKYVAPNLPTPPHVTGFNRNNPYSKAIGWQTQAERAAAVSNVGMQKAFNMHHGVYVKPYAYQDPHFKYPLEYRGTMAKTASESAAINRNIMARNAPSEYFAINVKKTRKRR